MIEVGPNDTPENGIYHGDFRELGALLPDRSVHLLLTDPPYLRDAVNLYLHLAILAKRVVIPGGYVVVYGAVVFVPQHLHLLSLYLDFVCLHILLHHGASPRLFRFKTFSDYKPVYIYNTNYTVRREPNEWIGTVVYRSAVDESSSAKRFHRWGQILSYPQTIISAYTHPGEIVFDPMVGGGTVPVAALSLNRRYIGFDIDEKSVETTRRRLREVQPVLTMHQGEIKQESFL